jgi:hypothetical protein
VKSRRTRDRRRVREAAGGLDERHEINGVEGQASLALDLGHEPVRDLDIVRPMNLGEHHAVDGPLHDGVEVAVAEFRRECVDADIAASAPRLLQRFDHDGARRHLLRDRARVLEIEDHGVRIERQRLGNAARMIAGSEQPRTAQAHVTLPRSTAQLFDRRRIMLKWNRSVG